MNAGERLRGCWRNRISLQTFLCKPHCVGYEYLHFFIRRLSLMCTFRSVWRYMFDFLRLRYSDQRTIAFILALSAVLLSWHTTPGKQETFEPKPYKFRIDLNSATLGELQTLPGIGPKLSESIVQYRDQHVPIHDYDEILNVSGVGPKKYSTMKPYFVD